MLITALSGPFIVWWLDGIHDVGCEFPVKAFRLEEVGPNGKRLITFNPVRSVNSVSALSFPCNNCMGCRLERARQWAVRMMHESKLYDQNCYITLTYNDQALPQGYGLDLRHWQLFMKRLRKRVPQKLRFFACGEYGDENGRPHYHAIIFNHDFGDKKFHDRNKQGDPIFISEVLDDVWGMGNCTTQDVTFKSAAYVARYCTKKINGDRADEHYYRLSPVDGCFHAVRPEFAVMSRMPGIGSAYVSEFKSDFFPSGFIVVNGVKQRPPQFYLSKLTEEERHRLKLNSLPYALKNRKHSTMERRMAKSAVLYSKIKTLKRDL